MLEAGTEDSTSETRLEKASRHEELKTLVEVWVLADKLLIPSLQNATIKGLQQVKVERKRTYDSHLELAYEKTKEGSALRRYLVATCIAVGWVKDYADHFPKEMLVDMLMLMRTIVRPLLRNSINEQSRMEEFMVPEE